MSGLCPQGMNFKIRSTACNNLELRLIYLFSYVSRFMCISGTRIFSDIVMNRKADDKSNENDTNDGNNQFVRKEKSTDS